MFGTFPRPIEPHFNLEIARSYREDCFKYTSASILANSGATVDVLKRLLGWKLH